jgi:hypothetical protein
MISSEPFYAYSYDNSFIRNVGSLFFIIIIAVGIYLILKVIELVSQHWQKAKDALSNYPMAK